NPEGRAGSARAERETAEGGVRAAHRAGDARHRSEARRGSQRRAPGDRADRRERGRGSRGAPRADELHSLELEFEAEIGAIVKRTIIVAVVVVLAATGARAQDLPPLQDQRPPDTRAAAPPMPREKLDRIYHIRQLEIVLTNAVKAGANSLAQQMQISEPNSLFVTSNARSRGTELEGYGVFFYVDVPTMLQSMVWSVQMRQERLQDLYRAQAIAADPKVPDSIRRLAASQSRSLEKQLGIQAPPPVVADAQQVPPPGVAVAATAENVIPASGRRTEAAAPAPAAPVTPVPPIVDPRNPNELYTDAIKDKLIDAMLNYGSALRLDDKEWLVIAARAVADPTPSGLDDSASILIRIKGEDLNAYMMQKLTK